LAKSTKTHEKLLDLLQKKEDEGKNVTLKEILEKTGWKESTFLTYLKKGQLSEFLNEVKDKVYAPSNASSLTVSQFTRRLSQSKHIRELGHKCKSRLAKALLKKSRDNMLLALELYNRPSLENRLDGFVLCFCTAWEQLLKSILIEKNGEEFIFRDKVNSKGIRETISLRECLDSLFKVNDPVKKNIERVTYFRDRAVHLLMPEVQGVISRIFQSGIMNYGSKFQEFSEQQFISTMQSGMLSLLGDMRDPTSTYIRAKYGEDIGSEVMSLLQEMNEEAKKVNDIEFAIPLNVKLSFTRNDETGNLIAISKADEGLEGLKKAIVIEKPVDRHSTHPYLRTAAIEMINSTLNERYNEDQLAEFLVKKDKITKKPIVNSYDFDAIRWKLKWAKSNNKHHYLNKNPEIHYYSDDAIELFVNKVMANRSYLENARDSYGNRYKI